MLKRYVARVVWTFGNVVEREEIDVDAIDEYQARRQVESILDDEYEARGKIESITRHIGWYL